MARYFRFLCFSGLWENLRAKRKRAPHFHRSVEFSVSSLPFRTQNNLSVHWQFCFVFFLSAFFPHEIIFALPGTCDRHVKAHEPAGWFEDNGGNEEGDKFWCPPPRQLFWQDPGKSASVFALYAYVSDLHETGAVSSMSHLVCPKATGRIFIFFFFYWETWFSYNIFLIIAFPPHPLNPQVLFSLSFRKQNRIEKKYKKHIQRKSIRARN